jgi:hypothetical protein
MRLPAIRGAIDREGSTSPIVHARAVDPDEATSHAAVAAQELEVAGDTAEDREPLHDGVARVDAKREVGGATGGRYFGSIELDHQHGVVANGERARARPWLGVTIDDDGIRDERQ